eukprot:m.25869 g.25869  ORF g.25869 m.25869 type:complete len:417 (+) comp15195_c0_seq1:87-1337(+)
MDERLAQLEEESAELIETITELQKRQFRVVDRISRLTGGALLSGEAVSCSPITSIDVSSFFSSSSFEETSNQRARDDKGFNTTKLTQLAAATCVRNQFMQHGCAVVAATNLPETTELEAIVSAKDFFTKLETKEGGMLNAVISNDDPARRGYSAPLSENFASLVGVQGANDYVHKFRVGPEITADDDDDVTTKKQSAMIAESSHFRANPWPPETDVPLFRTHTTRLYCYFEQLASACVAMLNLAYFPTTELSQVFETQHTSILSINWYNMQKEVLEKRVANGLGSIHPHTDISLFTLILVETDEDTGQSIEGLEIHDIRTDTFKAITVPKAHVIMIVGDLLSDITNNAVRATMHRVVSPKHSTRSRLSMVYFVSPSPSSTVMNIGDDVNQRPLSYDTWRKKRIKRAMKALKQQHQL